MTRIYSKESHPELDHQQVMDFFESRAKKITQVGLTKAVIYQDKSETLAYERDKSEKNKLLPKMDISHQTKFLDVGCGTGRWAKEIVNNCDVYYGFDASHGFINAAKIEFSNYSNVFFFQDVFQNFKYNKIKTKFNFCLISGVFIYLNDSDIISAFTEIILSMEKKSSLLIREPIALDTRLTLKEHFSEDMEQFYNAIYRTEDELLALLNPILCGFNFKLIESDSVYDDEYLNNRAETKQKYYLWKRIY